MTKLTKEQLFAINCAKSFKFFVESALKATPTNQQLEAISAIQKAVDGKDSKFITTRSGHGTGKTVIISWAALWYGLTKPNAKIPTLAPTLNHITKQIMPEIRKWYNKLYPPFQNSIEIQAQGLKFLNGNEMFCKTVNNSSEAVAGIHSEHLLFLIDEASGIDDNIFETLQGALTEENFVFLMMSNPTKVTGYFYNSHHKLRDQFQCLHFNSLESSNVTNDSFSEMIASDYGEDSDVYRVRVLGNFPTTNATGLFSLELIEEAMNRWEVADQSGARTLGVDVARYGDDESAIAYRKGMRIEFIQMYKNLDTQQIAQIATTTAHDYGARTIFVDTIGVGAGVFDAIRHNRGGIRAVSANASKTPIDKNSYINKRAEMYSDFKKWLENGGAIPHDETLKEEMLATDYFFNPAGKMQIIEKKLIKEILGRSPDKLDSCVFNFYEPVRKMNLNNMQINSFDWGGRF